jgi:hypothetical protein
MYKGGEICRAIKKREALLSGRCTSAMYENERLEVQSTGHDIAMRHRGVEVEEEGSAGRGA